MADKSLLSSTAYAVQATTNSNVSLEVVGIPAEQLTLPAGGTIKAGAPVYIDSNGKFVEGDGSAAGTADVYGIAIERCVAGQACTAIKRGIVSGYDFSADAFWSKMYVSDTAGVVGNTAGTVSKEVGRVIPVHSHIRGGSPLKALLVEVNLN
jgi:hypothetical protein